MASVYAIWETHALLIALVHASNSIPLRALRDETLSEREDWCLDMEDLSMLLDDTNVRRRRAALHEAGHAAYAWLTGEWSEAEPPFKFIEIAEETNEFGVVAGSFQASDKWFNKLNSIDNAVVTLAGWYMQEEHENLSNGKVLCETLREKLNDNSDCTVDIITAFSIGPDCEGAEQDEFWARVLSKLVEGKPQALPIAKALADSLVTQGRLDWTKAADIIRQAILPAK